MEGILKKINDKSLLQVADRDLSNANLSFEHTLYHGVQVNVRRDYPLCQMS